MLKRIFWLSVVALGGWQIWRWFRQRQSEFSDHAPQFAPAPAYARPRPAAIPAEARPPVAPAADIAPSAMLREDPAAAPAIDEREIDALFADEPGPSAAADAATEPPEIVGYCMRCHAKRPIKDAHEEISESGRRAARGTCPVCGTNMFTFLAANDDERGTTSET